MNAYLATTYRATAPSGAEVDLRPGCRSPELDAHLSVRGLAQWAFITACNPYSQVLTAEENRGRMAALSSELEELGFETWPGVGIGDGGDWEPEESRLVLGITEEQARAIAKRWEQNAIVVGEAGEVARVVWCLSSSKATSAECGDSSAPPPAPRPGLAEA